jgi:hypothetical protein
MTEQQNANMDGKSAHTAEMAFPIGAPNDAFAQYFIGQSYEVYSAPSSISWRTTWRHMRTG